MSRTIKGSKAQGWEIWGNYKERQEEAVAERLREYTHAAIEDETTHEYEMGLELDEAFHCHLYGPCQRCIKMENP